MRILSVTAQKPHSTGSGVYLTEVVREFCELGYEQAVVAGIYPEDEVHFPDEIRFYPTYFHSQKLPFAIAGMSDTMPYESTVYGCMTEEMVEQFKRAFLEVLAKAIAEFQPELIFCHHLYLLTALVRERYPDIKVVGLCHGSDLRQIKKNPLQRAYIREHIQKLDRIFVLHEEQKKEVVHTFDVQTDKVTVIGSGFNQKIFRPMEMGRDATHINLIFAGKISRAKGVFSLIRCLNQLSYPAGQLTLKLAGGHGGGDEYQEILNLAAECKYPVKFLGRLNQQALAAEMNQSNVFILPSFYEGLPLVLMEALACGVKVVATDLPGVKRWMDQSIEGHGIVFVKPPKMECIDEPKDGEEVLFEKRLAHGIEEALGQEQHTLNLDSLSWAGLCRKIISEVNRGLDRCSEETKDFKTIISY